MNYKEFEQEIKKNQQNDSGTLEIKNLSITTEMKQDIFKELHEDIKKIKFTNSSFKGGISFFGEIKQVELEFDECTITKFTINGLHLTQPIEMISSTIESLECKNNSQLNYISLQLCELDELYIEDTSINNKLRFGKVKVKESILINDCELGSIDLSGTRTDKLYFTIIKINDKINLEGLFCKEATILKLSSKDDSNVLKKENIENADTARFIKNQYRKQGDIVRANIYNTIEKDLHIQNSDTINMRKDILTLYLAKYTSNFGRDWILPLLWMQFFLFVFTSIYLYFGGEAIVSDKKTLFYEMPITGYWVATGITLTQTLGYIFTYKKRIWNAAVVFFPALVYILCIFTDKYCEGLNVYDMINKSASLMNPFNMFKPNIHYFDDMVLFGMFIKFTYFILWYQFIVAFRSVTRER